MLPWHAIRTKSRFEKTTAAGLRGKGLEEFLPLYTVKNRWSDRVKTVELPLFTGYVFCRLDAEHRLPVLTTPGVVEIVGMGGVPSPIPEHEIAAIQTISKAGVPVAPWPFLREGQRIRIERGALKDVEGILVAIKNAFRLVVSVDMLQRSVAVEVDRDSIRPL
jgi:transcription antitermination factor NusG